MLIGKSGSSWVLVIDRVFIGSEGMLEVGEMFFFGISFRMVI